MDHEFVKELVEVTKKNDGGTVLHIGDKAEVVVLTLERYQQLVAKKVEEDTKAVQNLSISLSQFQSRRLEVLVVGGAGYIGGHVVRELVDRGYKVFVIDNLSTGKREHVPDNVDFFEVDILDFEKLKQIFNSHKFNAVIHLAAKLEVEESVSQPVEYAEVNVIGTWNLIKIMKESGVGKLIFSSTAAVYGDGYDIPISETQLPKPNNPYGYSKLIAEKLIHYANRAWGLEGTIFRYFNVAGAHPSGLIGDTHLRSHLIPIVLEVALGRQTILKVNGNDYETFDGTCVRDYVSVLDIARAHVEAILHESRDEEVSVFNLGTGKGSSVMEVIASAAEVISRMIPMEVGPRRQGDAAMTVADCSLIKKEWGFETKHSELSEIIKSSWNQMQKLNLS